MTRYWQDRSGFVYTEGYHDADQYANHAEVRIVPADAIVIERSELPSVTVNEYGTLQAEAWSVGPGSTAGSLIEYARAAMGAYAAIVEYLTANPPVDEAQVKALVATLTAEDRSLGRHIGTTGAQYNEIARSLYRAGVRVVTS